MSTLSSTLKSDNGNSDGILFRCDPVDFLWIPKTLRVLVGAASMTLFAVIFLSVPITGCIFIFYHRCPLLATILGALTLTSVLAPAKEWIAARKFGQLWYDLLELSSSLNPNELEDLINRADNQQYIIAMHPHGIIPFHAILWSAYCDQYLSSKKTGKKLYGFGAAADIVTYLPFLRNIMGWLSAGSANYTVLKDGLERGLSACVNANQGRKPRHLYILPGGIAEIFTSTPGKHTIVCKKRKGLMRLSLETGANILPCYVFGGTDFFHNLATGSGIISKLCRKFRIGVTVFWGRLFLPIPYFPRVSICIAEPIAVERWQGEGPVPDQLILDLQGKYLKSIQDLFDKYKAAAGYPNAQLDVN